MSLLLALLLSSYNDLPVDTIYALPPVEVSVPVKQQGENADRMAATTTFYMREIQTERIEEPKDLSLITPNLYLPDYGSRMTSTIYIRGIGARMDQPSLGLYVDNVPVLNKNSYDFDFFDIRRIDVLRGPQGTLYGRNTIGGVLNIYTLSPFYYQGTRASVGYGNGNTWNARISTYRRPSEKLGYSVAVAHHSSDGFFTNQYTGEKADKILSENFRFRMQYKPSDKLFIDNTFNLNYIKQDGFAYSLYDEETGKVNPVNHNDPCTYDRFGLSNGLALHYTGNSYRLSSITSYQLLSDKMTLDQDFLPVSMFTLTQEQDEHAVTQEVILKSIEEEKNWQWLFGAFGFYKHISMDAPVTFKKNGIDQLILANANKGIHSVFPDADLLIEENEFVIASHFKLPAYGAALFHQSSYRSDNWLFTAGIRADYEHTGMKYRNYADLHYRFTGNMDNYKLLTSQMNGKESASFYEILPRFSALYTLPVGNVYAAISRGYKAGGYNTQIFSDILQTKMMNDMLEELGFYGDEGYDVGSATSYDPEYSWNYEIGTHLDLLEHSLLADVVFFYIDCRNQQLTVFPPGQSTGRLMSNAGRTRSYGAEVSLSYVYDNLRVNGSYGYTNARFIEYTDGDDDYSGNYVPYAPQNTLFLGAEYKIPFRNFRFDNLLIKADWRGAGKMYWNEDNSLSQSFYSLLGASVWLQRNNIQFGLWGKNLADKDYHTFYFKSIGNSFVQKGKPLQLGISINVNI